jgi:hypothetical protein
MIDIWKRMRSLNSNRPDGRSLIELADRLVGGRRIKQHLSKTPMIGYGI